jgi:hypothetical protein
MPLARVFAHTYIVQCSLPASQDNNARGRASNLPAVTCPRASMEFSLKENCMVLFVVIEVFPQKSKFTNERRRVTFLQRHVVKGLSYYIQ